MVRRRIVYKKGKQNINTLLRIELIDLDEILQQTSEHMENETTHPSAEIPITDNPLNLYNN